MSLCDSWTGCDCSGHCIVARMQVLPREGIELRSEWHVNYWMHGSDAISGIVATYKGMHSVKEW